MGDEERLEELQRQIGAIERRIEYITDPEFLDQFELDVREQWEAEARELTHVLTGKILEVRDVYNEIIGSKADELQDLLDQYNTGVIVTRVEAFIEEVGGRDASIGEKLANLARRLDVEELNVAIDIYNRANRARAKANRAISTAKGLPAFVGGLPDAIANALKKALAGILAGIRGGLEVVALEFDEVRDDWVGPKKIKDSLSKAYGGIVKGKET